MLSGTSFMNKEEQEMLSFEDVAVEDPWPRCLYFTTDKIQFSITQTM